MMVDLELEIYRAQGFIFERQLNSFLDIQVIEFELRLKLKNIKTSVEIDILGGFADVGENKVKESILWTWVKS